MRGGKHKISEDGSVSLFEGLTVNLREREKEREVRVQAQTLASLEESGHEIC